MTVHHMKRHVVPDMQAIHDQLDIMLRDLEVMVSTMALCHHVDQDLRLAAEHSLAATKRALLLSLRGQE